MSADATQSIFKEVELHVKANNKEHHTNELTEDELIVRRGQSFTVTLQLTKPFNPATDSLSFVAQTGKKPSEDLGTVFYFSIPDNVRRSASAKAVWRFELKDPSSAPKSTVPLTVIPSADAPIGEYVLTVKHKGEETTLAAAVVLFNPWCPDDSVFIPDEKERQEYVMNEQGIIYRGSANYIFPKKWDFGQFEDDMVRICMKILDTSLQHKENPAEDVTARCSPIYVSRVVSAMINCQDDNGVLWGQWGGPYTGGFSPSHWDGSHGILKRWHDSLCEPVKYAQCWVFAGVMCSVMRLLGIPCRVVTNFQSAHDTDCNLTIDVYHFPDGSSYGPDSVWNYHVWVEGWMRRPDLSKDGKYDGWQVLDPTPQEQSKGIYCCGPASVAAIRNGDTDLQYDVPFVFAEVNADCIDWLVDEDSAAKKIDSDTKRVGQNISTKSVGSEKRKNITDNYKHREGTEKERAVFKYALTRDYSTNVEDEENEETEETGEEAEEMEEDGEVTDTSGGTNGVTPVVIPPLPEVSLRFEMVSELINGEDVKLNLVLHSESSVARPLTINISVQGMMYNGPPAVKIQTEVKEETLQPGKDLTIQILVPFLVYHKHMVECDSMKISAMVTDKKNPDKVYLGENDIVLQDPPLSITVPGVVRLYRNARAEIIFKNPANEVLTQCTLTLSGSGLLKEEFECKLPDLNPNNQFRIKFSFVPYKKGKKTLMVDIDCSTFRDIKGSCTVTVAG